MSKPKQSPSEKFNLHFIRFTAVSIIIIALLLITWKLSLSYLYYTEISYSRYSLAILIFGILYFLFGLLIYLKPTIFLNKLNLFSALLTINTLYFIIELSLYFISGFPSITFDPTNDNRTFYFNQPCIKYNEIRGYRWFNKNSRQVLLSDNNKVVWDSKINFNNKGYPSTQDYFYKKKNKNIKRYIVLGDSFTAAEFNNESWVDYAQRLLKDKNIELYSFSLSGIGLQNWHNIYFKEIVPNYEFDGIIFAFLSSDWQRPFTIFHTDTNNKLLIGGFNQPPKDSVDFHNNYLYKMSHKKKWKVASDKIINTRIKSKARYRLETPTLYAVELFYYNVFLNIKVYFTQHSDKKNERTNISPREALIKRQSAGKIKLLDEVINNCKNKKKEVILASIPFKKEILSYKENRLIDNNESLKQLSEIYNLNYFNCYQIFSYKTRKELDAYFYKEDLHWNDKGSQFYGKSFATYLDSLK